MCPISYGIACLYLFTAVKPVPTFELGVCAPNATDIVVTTPDGRVLESWRGELKPGDVVRLGAAGLTPANALPLERVRLHPDRAVSALYDPSPLERSGGFMSTVMWRDYVHELLWAGDGNSNREPLRLVLFLRKGGTARAGAVWMPAAQPAVQLNAPSNYQPGFRPNFPPRPEPLIFNWREPNDFTTSVAHVEGGRVVAWRNGHPVRLATSAAEFRQEILGRPAPASSPDRWDELLPAPLPPGGAAGWLLGSLR